MNIEEYISSGILEAYAMGELSELERREVEKNLTQFKELREELLHIENTVETLLDQLALKPRAEVKTKLFDTINKKSNTDTVAKVVPMFSTVSSWRYATAASIAFALLSSYLAFNYWNRWKNSETTLTNLITQNQQVAKDYNTVNQRLNQIELDIKVTKDPYFTRVVMRGTPNAPQAMASVYWNATTNEVYLGIQNLKQLSQENQYQLWAIIDGKPVDCGVFDGQLASLVKMKGINHLPSTFAVTIEPRGGNSSPSLETMQVAGNLSAG
jgi:anti-sigma-K factor RskA